MFGNFGLYWGQIRGFSLLGVGNKELSTSQKFPYFFPPTRTKFTICSKKGNFLRNYIRILLVKLEYFIIKIFLE